MRKSVLRTLLVLTALLTIGGLIGSAQVLAADAGWLSGWANRMAITIDHSRISSSLTNFPVMINISSASGTNSANISNIFNILGNNSKKLAVTTSDGLTQCNVEVARWDSTNKQAVLWVNVPSISSSVDTVIYLYYDNSHVDNTTMVGDTGSAPAEKVWDSNFVGVWHLTQSGNGIAGEFKDSTNRHHDGQGAGGLGYGNPTLTTSNTPMGAAQSFNGKNAYINVPDCDDFSITTTNNLTVSCWLSLSTLVQPTSTGGYTRYIGKSSAGQHEWFSEVYDYNSSYNRSQWISNYVLNPSGGLGAGDYSSGSFGVNDWLYITNTFHGNSPTSGWENIYRGPAIRTGSGSLGDSWESYGIKYANGSAPFTIGTGWVGSGNFLAGRMGEVRISNVVRSNAWIAASYYAEMDKLMSYGTVESNGSSNTPVPTPAPTPAPTTTPTPTPVPALSRVFGIDSGNAVYDCSWFNAQRFLNTAGDGILTRLELLVNDTTPAGNVRLGVYADNNGIPGNLLLDAGEATAVNGWTGINNLNLQVKSSSYYWLAFLPQNALGVSYQTSGMEVNCHTCYGYPYGSLPATFGKGEFNSTPFVMRASVNILAPSQEPESKTFGLDNGNSTWNQKAGILDAMRFTNTAGSGYLTKLELLFADSTPSGKVRFGVYADNYSKPGNRLLDAGETSVVNGWASISNLCLPVKANTSYWLAFDMQSGNTVRYQSGQAANSHYWVSYQYGTLPYSYPSAYRYVNNSPYVMRATVVSQ